MIRTVETPYQDWKSGVHPLVGRTCFPLRVMPAKASSKLRAVDEKKGARIEVVWLLDRPLRGR